MDQGIDQPYRYLFMYIVIDKFNDTVKAIQQGVLI